MARIQGITIELSADASNLEGELKKVNSASINTQKELKQIDKALKFDPGNTVLLQQKMEVLGDAVNNTSTKLDALRQAQQDLDRQAAEGRAIDPKQYRALAREIEMTEGQLRSFQAQVDRTQVRIDAQADVSGLDKMTKKLEEVGEKAKEVGDKMKNVGTEMSTKLTAPLAAFGGGALLAAGQFDNAAGQIQAALGVTADEAAALEDKATSVWKAGFGESLEEVSGALVRVKQNMKDIDGSEIEQVTQNALALAKSFDSDVNEVTRGANNLMENFGLTAEEAFDMLAKGAQNGLNFSNELFDNVAEYAPLWSDMGYSAEEMFGILEAGTEAGVYNLDYLNDVMKEFQIRATDGSKATTEAVGELGPEVRKVWEAFSKGEATVADMAAVATGELSKIDDKVKQNELGVALFGTKWEDLGGDVVLSMLTANEAMTDFEGAMDSVSQAQEQTFGQRWESFIRTATASLEPLGKILLDLAEQWLPKIIAVVERLATWFSNLSPVMQGVTVAIGAIVAAIGPFLVVAGMIASAIGNLIPIFIKLLPVIKGAGVAIAGISAPVAIAIAAVTALIAIGIALYKNWDVVSAWLKKTWETIKSNAVSAFNQIKTSISQAWESVKPATTSAWNAIKSALTTAWNALKSTVTSTFDSIKTSISNAWNAVKTATSNVWNGIKSTLTSLWNGLKSTVTSTFNGIKSAIDTVWNSVKTFTTNTWNTMKSSIQNTINTIKDVILAGMQLIKGDWQDAWNTLKSTLSNMLDNMKSILRGTNLFNIGKDIIQGLVNGIGSMVGKVQDKVKSIVDTVKNAITGVKGLDMNSPSKVTMKYGMGVNEGLIVGMEKSSNDLQRAMNNVYGSLASSAQKSAEVSTSNIKNATSTIDNSKYMQPQIHITVQGGNMSPSEIARKALQTQRQLAMEWGV